MKMFRPALAGALSAFVLLVCIQLNARVKVAAPSQSRQLFFEDRVAYQRAIEEVYWRHRIWPNNRPDPKPSLDALMSQAAIEKKVQDYLRHSELLEQEWQKPITPEQLQAEMDRMAQHTKQPEVLRELFATLGNDPFVIAECLARPVLAERFANGDPVAAAPALSARRTGSPRRVRPVAGVAPADPAGMPPQKPVLAGWLAKAETQVPMTMAAATANYTLPAISDQPSGCIDDSWTATTTTRAPLSRLYHTAVWTGTEMIVWGGNHRRTPLNTGGRYNASTDSWTATSTTNAPDARDNHTAVWTGTEMIVWGGLDVNSVKVNTGGRYNPSTDSWTATSTTNAPTGRYSHTAVWTGSEMIVWGGTGIPAEFNTGGRYNPDTDSWTATNRTNAPTARYLHTAVWTGTEMIVWGGLRVGSGVLNTGGRYNPSTDSWTATNTTSAPTAREGHTAAWTDTEMIVWGGSGTGGQLNTGGRYNPSTDSWTPTSTTDAPTARLGHTAVWTSSEMIVWGGTNNSIDFNTGGRYCAQAASPTPTPTPPPQITLSAKGRKVGGINTVRLTWDGATSPNVDVYRNEVVIVTTANDGLHIDSTGDTGRARYTYQVCEAGAQTCSNEKTVSFQQ